VPRAPGPALAAGRAPRRRALAVAAITAASGCALEPREPGAELGLAAATAPVVGGAAAPAGRWPDVAAILFAGRPACTGVLVAPTVVLTAGHCDAPDLSAVLIGTASLARPEDGETIPVARRVEHPSSQTTRDLLALVLERPSRIAPRAIATGWAAADIRDGAPVAIVGYGAIDRDARQYVAELQQAETAITDAECARKLGCNASVKPGGELGAGGMGVDTCPGDSGGPLYLITPYGELLAGLTSRSYDDAQFACTEGGIYTRPDAAIAWIEESTGVAVTRGPEPTAEPIMAVRGGAGETTVAANDPRARDHRFAIATGPARGAARVRDDGRVRVCTDGASADPDAVVVRVTDAAAPARATTIRIPVLATDGAPASACDVEAFEDEGGCCSAGGGTPAASAGLALAVAAAIGARRRGRPRRRAAR
jgi:endonuclease G